MFKPSHKEVAITSPGFENEKPKLAGFTKIEDNFQKIEERFKQEALENIYYKSLITLALGKEFSERTNISKNEVERFTLLYSTDSDEIEKGTYKSIIPIQKMGFSWQSPQSSNLRRKYKVSAEKMFERLELCNFGSNFESGKIELFNIPYKTIDYLDFSSAAAIVDKRPRKRKDHNSGDAVYFRDFYMDGKRALLFGVFDGVSFVNSNSDEKSSAILLSLFKKYFNSVGFSNEETLFSLFKSFLNTAENELSKLNCQCGASMSIGIVCEKTLYYLNIGDTRIYSISFGNEVLAKKITTDDGMAGIVQKGGKVDYQEFYSQLSAPQMYTGSFSQNVSGKKRVMGNISIAPQNIGKISLENSDFLFVCTDGFWANLPFLFDGENILDASGKQIIEILLEKSRLRNPKQILELFYNYSKGNMKLKSTAKFKNSIIRPNQQDIGLLGFSI
ncbi:MAG: hypothetical protein WC501_04915 [Candidatus Micrarchaeia archaeon]